MIHSMSPEPEHPDGVITRSGSVFGSSAGMTGNELKPRLIDLDARSAHAFQDFDWQVLDELASVPVEPDETEAESAVRRAIDIQLLAILTDGRLSDDELHDCYKKICRRLSAHGYQVLIGWAKTGQIFTKCGTSMTPIMRPHAGWSDEDIDMVVKDTVIETARTFKHTGLRAWDPAGGRSPQSFFIEHCTQNFPRIYNRWRKDYLASAEVRHLGDDEPGFDQLPGAAPDPVDVVIRHDTIDRAVRALEDRQLRAFLGFQAAGYEPASARDLAGLTRKAASYRLAKYRQLLEGGASPSPTPVDPDDRA